MNHNTAVVNNEPPEVVDITVSLGINKDKWKQYQEEGYSPEQIEAMLKRDIERAIWQGSKDTINRLIDGDALELTIGKYR